MNGSPKSHLTCGLDFPVGVGGAVVVPQDLALGALQTMISRLWWPSQLLLVSSWGNCTFLGIHWG